MVYTEKIRKGSYQNPEPVCNSTIEGVKGLEGDTLRHINAFHVLLKDWFCQKNYTSILLTREGYNKRVEFGLYLNNGGDSRGRVN